MAGIEPVSPAWEAGILPMNYTCVFICAFIRSTKLIIAEKSGIARGVFSAHHFLLKLFKLLLKLFKLLFKPFKFQLLFKLFKFQL